MKGMKKASLFHSVSFPYGNVELSNLRVIMKSNNRNICYLVSCYNIYLS